LIIDESYNSNPLSLVAALDFFKKRTWPYRKVAILGDMRELGSLSREYHYKIADWADFADLVILVGEEVKIAQPKLEQKGVKSLYYPDVASLAKDLPQLLKPQDLILVKGSQAVRLEKIIALILSSRYNPKDVLVRQEKEWEGGNYSN